MKKILSILLAVMLISALSACDFIPGEPTEPVVHPEAVILEKTELTLEVGAEETLMAIVDLNATDRSVTWGSSDDTVATVDVNGKVTGVAVGTATITVTTNDGGKTATCTVTVTPVPGKVILEVKGTNSKGEETDILTFRDDGTYTMHSMFLGAVECNYDSTYEVVDGVLIVPNPGPEVNTTFGLFPSYPKVEVYGDTVRFTAGSNNGSDIILGYFELSAEDAAKLGITVGEPIQNVPATGIVLTQDSVDLLAGTKLDLSSIINVLPENATNKNYTVAIATNVGNVLRNDNGVLGLSAGSATVTITTEDGGFTATCTVNVTYPERTIGNNWFAKSVALAGKMDLSLFGGSAHDILYIFNSDGSVEAYQDYILSQRGYYSLTGNEGSYTSIELQMFVDGVGSRALSYADGKLTSDFGLEGILPAIVTETKVDTDYFDTDVTFEGDLDLSAFIPGWIQKKTYTCYADGTVTSTTDGNADSKTNSYRLFINEQGTTIVLDMGTDGVFIATLDTTDGIRSFTLTALNMTLTEKSA